MAVWPTSIFTADQWCRPCWFLPIKTGPCAMIGWWERCNESPVCIGKSVQRHHKEPWRPSGQLTWQKEEKKKAHTCSQRRDINQQQPFHNRTHFDWSIHEMRRSRPKHGFLHGHSSLSYLRYCITLCDEGLSNVIYNITDFICREKWLPLCIFDFTLCCCGLVLTKLL